MKTSGDPVITRDRVIGELRSVLRNGWDILLAALSEIFDESAYQRFLQRSGLRHSSESYRAFQVERDTIAATKPRCC